ncbi:MAG: hypothetical protein WBQ74_05855 [Candidatus Sulfotelmatobacter sp.]|jgi:hypothetical protein
MPMGAYITYSNLFDRIPSWDEIIALIKGLPMLTAAATLMRMNMALRFALQEPNRPNFGRLQQVMVNDFTDDETYRRLQERFTSVLTDERPIFLPLADLNVLRLVLTYSREGDPLITEDIPALRHSLGTACLMMNNLLLSAEEERQITEGDEDARRLALLVQTLAPFELAFPPVDSHLLFRYGVMFRMLLDDPAVRARIVSQCRGFDFQDEFKALTGITLERWLHIVFAIYSYYLHGGNVFEPHPEFSFFDPNISAAQLQVTSVELDAVLKSLSTPLNTLRQEIAQEVPTDPRFDFVPFRSHPLVPIATGRVACIDLAFLLEKLHTGVHWVMHDAYDNRRSRRDDLFKAWGILFEEYVHWLLLNMESTLPMTYFRPQWERGDESFDGMLLQGDVLVPMEYKGGFLARGARYSANTGEFTKDVDKKFGLGCHQLASKLNLLFAQEESQRKRIKDAPPLTHIRAVVPVLVLQDNILRAPFLNWYLNRQFQRELASFSLSPNIVVRALTVVNVFELETMVNSSGASGFDFIYALHLRAIRDEKMLSQLPDVLRQFPTYGRKQSARWVKVYEELQRSLFGSLFPEN